MDDMSVSEAIHYIKGKPGTPVTLTIMRKNNPKPIIMTLTRETVRVTSIQSKLLAPGYGYVSLAFFQGPVALQLKKAIAQLTQESGGKLKGFILDLRNNPGGLLDSSADVVDLFLDKKETMRYHNLIVYTKGRAPDSNMTYPAHDHDMIPHVPMIVLINGGSASASEITAGALQDYKRAIIMGTRSFGKGSVQTVIPISVDSAIKLTTALYYTPAGREIQARGIEPDVIIPELSVSEKQIENLSSHIDESNYDRHIENKTGDISAFKTVEAVQKKQQQSALKLAKDDYQVYEAFMLLKGMHAALRLT